MSIAYEPYTTVCGKLLVNLANDSQFTKILPYHSLPLKYRECRGEPIYCCQKFGKCTFTNIFPLPHMVLTLAQFFASGKCVPSNVLNLCFHKNFMPYSYL